MFCNAVPWSSFLLTNCSFYSVVHVPTTFFNVKFADENMQCFHLIAFWNAFFSKYDCIINVLIIHFIMLFKHGF